MSYLSQNTVDEVELHFPTCACATNGRRRIRGSLNILRKILWKNVLNIRKGIVGDTLSQIVVERCRFSVNHVLAARL